MFKIILIVSIVKMEKMLCIEVKNCFLQYNTIQYSTVRTIPIKLVTPCPQKKDQAVIKNVQSHCSSQILCQLIPW